MRNALKLTTPTDREIVITREFNAPRALVWDALFRPEFLRRWMLGPPGWEMTECEEDPRVGGSYRCAWSGPDGATMALHGVYREVSPPERCVRTEVFAMGSGPPMADQQATLVLTDLGERTSLTITILYASKEARDGAASSGMEQGMAASYERLDAILAEALA